MDQWYLVKIMEIKLFKLGIKQSMLNELCKPCTTKERHVTHDVVIIFKNVLQANMMIKCCLYLDLMIGY